MTNDITKLLNFEDEDILIENVRVEGRTKVVEISRVLHPHYCPVCGCRMHSKGIYTRRVKHQMIQDGFFLILELHQRRWQCTSTICKETSYDDFSFISPRKRTTDLQDLLILDAFRDVTASVSSIAKRFNVSDTYAHRVFDRYVDMKRYPLSEAISVDEVYLDMPGCKYALMIIDLLSGEPIDMLPSRTGKATEDYFSQIPIAERNRVKYLVTDMFHPYTNYVNRYFLQAISVVDSFHVIQAMNNELDIFRKNLLAKFFTRDKEIHDRREKELGRKLPHTQSDEVYLLKNKRWILFANKANINYNVKPRRDPHFKSYLDNYALEHKFMNIDPNIPRLIALRDKYYDFNILCIGQPDRASEELDQLIYEYSVCDQEIFRRFSKLLSKHRTAIIGSFVTIPYDGKLRRLSNGPIESMNRIPKDMVRQSRGYLNFDHIRNRFLFATRTDASILAIPKNLDDVQLRTGNSRGSYKKDQ